MHDQTKMSPDGTPDPDADAPTPEGADTPSLFDGMQEDPPAAGKKPDSTESAPQADGLERLATRLSGEQSPGWAMNWRPTGKDEAGEIPGDHHPARTAGMPEEKSIAIDGGKSTTSRPDDATMPADMPADEPAEDHEPIESTVAPDRTPESTADAPPLVTSRTWEGRTERHPQPPARSDDARTDLGPKHGQARRARGNGGLGWVAAAIIGALWIGIEITSPSPRPSTPVPMTSEGTPNTPPLARPAPDPERAMMLEEIGILQDELSVLRGEIRAATILREDHERISLSLQRFERRWATALDQLQFLEASLQQEHEERMSIAAELDQTQRLLDEARGTD